MDALGDHDTLLGSLMRQHWATNNIAHCPHAGRFSRAIVIDEDKPTFIHRDTRVSREQSRGSRASAHSDDQAIKSLRFAGIALQIGDVDAVTAHADVRYSRAQTNIESLLCKDLAGLRRDLLVHIGQELIHRFQHHDLCPEARPHATELQSDHTRSYHSQALRDGLEAQGTG